jgi:hypothetical protein
MGEKNGPGAGRIAAAAINIARGAAVGGLKGAAVGAVKSFLPEIIKVGVALICILVILPLLLFAALPNILFGYDNALADDIIDFTAKAYSIDAAYKDLDEYTLMEIERIVLEITEAYESEDGPAYDNIVVNASTGNTNIFWFIAINSVVHMQLFDERGIHQAGGYQQARFLVGNNPYGSLRRRQRRNKEDADNRRQGHGPRRVHGQAWVR